MNAYLKRNNRPELLLICGSGRNTGKTLLACNIIKWFKDLYPITAVKISMHRHDHGGGMDLLEEGTCYKIWEDVTISHKDSGRFLEAGAAISIYIETSDEYLYAAFASANKFFASNSMVICESGGLVQFIKPALLLYVQEKNGIVPGEKAKIRSFADLVADVEMITKNPVAPLVQIKEGHWILSPK
jgi:hypothetical protein